MVNIVFAPLLKVFDQALGSPTYLIGTVEGEFRSF